MTERQPNPGFLRRLFVGWPHDIAVAAAFLTRLPFRPRWDGPDDLSQAARAFVVAGVLVGFIGGGALWLAAKADLHPLACALIGLLAAAVVTGALHEDGLADVADGLGATSRERRLEIMRDSRIGSYGVLALIFAVGIKAAILAGLPGPGLALGAFITAAALSRAVMPLCMATMRPAREDGLGHGAGRPDLADAVLGFAVAVLIAIALFGWIIGPSAVVAALVAMALGAWLAQARFGGYTGDVLGAVQQCAEVSVLIVIGAYLP